MLVVSFGDPDRDEFNVHECPFRHSYVRNNPLTRVDADGHCPPCEAPTSPDVVGPSSPGYSEFISTLEAGGSALADLAELGVTWAGGAVFAAFATQSTAPARYDQLYNEETGERYVPEAQASAGGAMHGNGRGGKQRRLNELATDPKVWSADRGWLQNEKRNVRNGKRRNLRVPPGKHLAHRRGKEARKGYDYEHSDLQDQDLHQTQHQIERMSDADKIRQKTQWR
jgi:hypothetical protein